MHSLYCRKKKIKANSLPKVYVDGEGLGGGVKERERPHAKASSSIVEVNRF